MFCRVWSFFDDISFVAKILLGFTERFKDLVIKGNNSGYVPVSYQNWSGVALADP